MNPEWLAKYKPLSDAFMTYGWFVAPFIIGAEFKEVEETAAYIAAHPPADDRDRQAIEDRIYRALCEPTFHPVNRARATWYGNQLRHFREFNHLYESAMFAYYKREYASAVLLLLSALEGIMLSYYGFQIGTGGPKPSIGALIGKIAASHAPPRHADLSAAHDMYRDTLVKFLKDWIYEKTQDSDFSLSVLNRHYVLHGMEPGNFYRPQDLHRLILAFDLVVEFLSFQQGVFHTFLPDLGEDAFIDQRRDYYWALASGRPTAAQSWAIERDLLKQHLRYVAPSHDPNLEESFAKAELWTDIEAMVITSRSRGPRP
ncbi:MAG: hypothetical protein WDN31_02685 [Hyphomicrobium sp.]